MTFEELEQTPVSEVSHRDIANLLWESNRRLVDALAAIEVAALREEDSVKKQHDST